MTQQLQPEPELRLLLEDFGKGRRVADNGLRQTPRIAPGPEAAPLRLLVEDFAPARRFWEDWPPPQRAASRPDEGPPPELLIAWDDRRGRRLWTQLGSLGVHLIWAVILLLQPYVEPPRDLTEPEENNYTRITLAPPNLEDLRQAEENDESGAERAELYQGETVQPDPPATPEPQPVQPLEPDEPKPQPAQPLLVEEPEPQSAPTADEPAAETPPIQEARSPEPDEFQRGRELARARDPRELPAPRPAPKKPALQLEDPKASLPSRPDENLRIGGLPLNPRPGQIVESAIEKMVEQGGGRQAVGDGVGVGSSGAFVPPSPGNIGSGLELLSDPKGVDFRPYLLQILNTVRRNWYAVIPESARLGMERGRVAIQFAIAQDGAIPKLVIADSSGSQPLDRAAVAGISASQPLPPLPPDFTGDQVRLQFVFLYNIRR